MDKRAIMAIALVFLILFLWPLVFSNKKKASEEPPTQSEQQIVQKKEEKPKTNVEIKPVIKPIAPRKSESFVIIQTPLYEAKFSSDGAKLVSLKLKEYANRVDKNEPMELIPTTAKKCLTVDFRDEDLQSEVDKAQWTADKQSLNLGNGTQQGAVEFRYVASSGLEIFKRLSFTGDSYLIGVDVSFRNLASPPIKLKGYDLTWGEGLTEDEMIPPQN